MGIYGKSIVNSPIQTKSKTNEQAVTTFSRTRQGECVTNKYNAKKTGESIVFPPPPQKKGKNKAKDRLTA